MHDKAQSPQGPSEGPLLEIKDLSVRFPVPGGEIHAVNGVDLSVSRGKTLGIVGESGCGKSVLALSALRLHPKTARIRGEILLRRPGGVLDIASLPEKSRELGKIRGGEIAMIFQEPMRALFPLKTVGDQLGEALRLHVTRDKEEIRRRSVELLGMVGIRDPQRRLEEYPHQFSGGMCQRVMIAIALAGSPQLLIADEPTTALDVTIQAQVLALIRKTQQELGMGILFISHDMGVIMEMSDEVAVMYLGRVVERAPAEEIFSNPLHPYTRLLFQSIPTIGGPRERRLATIEGSVPIPLNLGEGCGFCSRCPRREEGCAQQTPPLREVSAGHWVACLLQQGPEGAGEAPKPGPSAPEQGSQSADREEEQS